ncbi:MAG: type II toxin-antitoxin system HicA family toxin [archaeon]|nr:type II toxin-antitoxin system HicA family toxin [archaeon]
MPKLAVISGKQALKVATKLGYQIIRQTGSHVILRNDNRKRLVIPMHKTLKTGTLLQIIKELEISKEEFEKLL